MPAALGGSGEEDYNMDGSDVDAEGEEDEEYELANEGDLPGAFAGEEDANESDVDPGDAEGEQEEDEESGDDFVGAVKVPRSRKSESDEDVVFDDGSDADGKDSSAEEEEDDDSDKSSSDEDSPVEEQWEGNSQAEEIEAEVATRNNCM